MSRYKHIKQDHLSEQGPDIASLQHLLQATDYILTPVMITDSAYNHLFHNTSFNQQTGYSMKEVYNIDSWYETVFPDPTYRAAVRRDWFGKLVKHRSGELEQVNIVVNICCYDQTYHWFDIHEHVYGEFRVITFLNVDALQEKSNLLLDVLYFKRTLLASLSHDIRGPLGSLQTFLKHADKFNLSDARWNELMSRMSGQVDQILHLVDATVIHQATELEHYTFNVTTISVRFFTEKILGYFQYDMREKNINTQLNFDNSRILQYDLFILEVVFRNILSNAVKYTPENGSIHISFHDEADDFWDIHFSNTGPGLTTEQIENFTRNRSSRTEREEIRYGFGLGLLIAKDSFEKHFGKLLVENVPGKGTTFIVRIPKYIPSFVGTHHQ